MVNKFQVSSFKFMLVIRLLRIGRKNQPFFKVVVTDKRNSSKGGRFREQVGFVNPLTKEKSLKGERIKYWISKGAKLSDTVHNLLISESIIKGKKIALHKKKKGQAKPGGASPEIKPEKPASPIGGTGGPEDKKEEPEAKPEEKPEEEPKKETGEKEEKTEVKKGEQDS